MTMIQMYLAIFLTMVPIVTALPIHSLTRDNVAKHNKNHLKVVKYLLRYGFLHAKPDVRNLSQKQTSNVAATISKKTKYSSTDDEISNGLKNFQNSLGLKDPGELNDETKKLHVPRCGGVSDEGHEKQFQLKVHHRSKRYTIYHKSVNGYKIFKWSKKLITWQIYRPWSGGSISKTKQEEIFDKAFKLWEYASPLKFEKRSKWPDIIIEFLTGSHGDQNPFNDGPGGELAHAFLPGSSKDGDIHMDSAEKWTETTMYNVAVHEIGHSLGLGHSSYYDSIMYNRYSRNGLITSLHEDDKNGLNKIYGDCQTRIDATMSLKNGDVYFMRKDLVWKFDSTSDRVHVGYPKKINDEFPSASGPKIPSNLDCASRYLAEQSNKDYYLFVKDDKVYIYDMIAKRITLKTTSEFWPSHGRVPGIPKNVSVVVSIAEHPSSGTWIFQNGLAWEYDNFKIEIRQGNPINVANSHWNGLPNDVDDGYYDEVRDKFYFFKDTQYFEGHMDNFFPETRSKAKPYIISRGYIHKKWKGICSAKYNNDKKN
ncbi:interstitial collagenase-like [Dendronephthya gigantea]|uniref:interstitial collagenase-like n=1 Tax=Dendronephthya gigantea TaxID=151771 RepID=UPI00106AC7F4|nr:interstitial collagenase-like [Dendronephthya gigantea]